MDKAMAVSCAPTLARGQRQAMAIPMHSAARPVISRRRPTRRNMRSAEAAGSKANARQVMIPNRLAAASAPMSWDRVQRWVRQIAMVPMTSAATWM